jgi:chromosomal replication initiator protein
MENKKINYWSAPDILVKKSITKDLDRGSLILKVCNFYGITLQELMSKTRLRKIVDARNILYYIFHRCYKLTSTEVGKMFNKNHATILSGANKIEGFIKFDKVFKIQINQFINIEEIKYN